MEVFPELINIVNHRPVTFENYRYDRAKITARIKAYAFSNSWAITKSMLVWWAMSDPSQPLLPVGTVLEIEYVYARKRNEVSPLANSSNLESLGKKSVLEKRVNIRAADYRFENKKKHYLGYVNDKGQRKDSTQVRELVQMANSRPDFLESGIEARTDQIIDSFVAYLDANGLVKSS